MFCKAGEIAVNYKNYGIKNVFERILIITPGRE